MAGLAPAQSVPSLLAASEPIPLNRPVRSDHSDWPDRTSQAGGFLDQPRPGRAARLPANFKHVSDTLERFLPGACSRNNIGKAHSLSCVLARTIGANKYPVFYCAVSRRV